MQPGDVHGVARPRAGLYTSVIISYTTGILQVTLHLTQNLAPQVNGLMTSSKDVNSVSILIGSWLL